MGMVPQESGGSLEELYDYLKRFRTSDSLVELGRISFVLESDLFNLVPIAGIGGLGADGDRIRTLIGQRCRDEIAKKELLANAARLARFLLLSPVNDYKSQVLKLGVTQTAKALDLSWNVYDPDAEIMVKGKADFHRAHLRVGQWQFILQQDPRDWFARAYLLFHEIPQTTSLDSLVNEAARDAVGMLPLQFIAAGYCVGLLSFGVLVPQLNVDGDLLTNENLTQFASVSSLTQRGYCEEVRGKDEWRDSAPKQDAYLPDPLMRYPLIKPRSGLSVGGADMVVPVNQYVFFRATSGLLYAISERQRETAQSPREARFRAAFGRIVQHYVRFQLAQCRETSGLFLDLDGILTDYGPTKPDFALVKGETAVLFEVKLGLLTRGSKFLGDEKTLEADFLTHLEPAVDQLNGFAQAIYEKRVPINGLEDVKQVVKVVVTFDNSYLSNADTLPLAGEVLGKKRLAGVQLATLDDIDFIGGLLAEGEDVVPPLAEKADIGQFGGWIIWMFLRDKVGQPKSRSPYLEHGWQGFTSLLK